MGRANLSQKLRQDVLNRYDNKCANCGVDGVLEIHHIVPVSRGGTDSITNLVPLCHCCHHNAHTGRNIMDSESNTFTRKSGRKPKCSDEVFDAAFKKYISGRIGKKKLCELTGYKPGTIATPLKNACERHGIAKVRNNIDLMMAVGMKGFEIREGQCCGDVTFCDGTVRRILYRDTNENDVEYVKRHTHCGAGHRKTSIQSAV